MSTEEAKLLLRNVSIYQPDDVIENGMVIVSGGRIIDIKASSIQEGSTDIQIYDGHGLNLTPGFVDLQINGGFGWDFTSDPGSIWQVGSMLPQYGVTSFLPTLITTDAITIHKAQEMLMNHRPEGYDGAEPLGLHIEGPFLNPLKHGAHLKELLKKPSLNFIRNWKVTNGVRMVTLAPELDQAQNVIQILNERGIIVSAGHTNATFSQAMAGFNAGISCGTHLFNAMRPLHHREPGIIGALLEDERCSLGLIVDGIHIHPTIVNLVYRLKGCEKIFLVTDAIAALGKENGVYKLSDQEIFVSDGAARLADGRLAGSVISLDRAFRNFISFTHCAPQEGLKTITSTPANVLNLSGEIGKIAVGARADFVIMDDAWQVVRTYINGKLIYKKD